MIKKYLIVSIIFVLSACRNETHSTITGINTDTMTSDPTSVLVQPTVSENIPTLSNTQVATPAPDSWKSLPVVPKELSQRMIEVFQRGLLRGRDPNKFSKIGDCQNITTYFLAAFDDPVRYQLGQKYAYLQPTIDHFSGSWSRESLAVKGGMNVAAVQNPFWTLSPKPDVCTSGEPPLACEISREQSQFCDN